METMPNSLPYLILVAVCTIALSVMLLHKRALSPLILLLSYSGMIYVFEFFIFVLFHSYSYSPKIVGTSYYDNVLGAVFSNLISVPAAAAYVAVYQLSWRWIAFFAFAFGAIELSFLRLGIYEHHWWRTAYTIVSLIIFFRLARQWPIWLSGRHQAIKFVTLVMFAWSVVATMIFVFALTNIRIYHVGIFEDPYHDDIFFSAMYGFVKALLLAVAVTVSHRLWRRALWLLLLIAAQFILMHLGLLKVMLPLWQYWLIYIPCCITVMSIVALCKHKLDRFQAEA
ncbi:hypothetical protein [Bacillus sp. 3255]|uniref:hypothetical protein n=1 Tax=Bacillus sp. 3255 TaxID=2817904 RepID=UPI00285AB687|nr:hypothetical protein [Bacillus sp. 3255]MDR6879244.1 hypothetical protein [Bacillus sp. 3255]